jgi:hypothetical protein
MLEHYDYLLVQYYRSIQDQLWDIVTISDKHFVIILVCMWDLATLCNMSPEPRSKWEVAPKCLAGILYLTCINSVERLEEAERLKTEFWALRW